MKIIFSNKIKLAKTIATIKAQGTEKLHILSDFDRTLTYGYIDGKKTPSIISILRNGHYLSPDYAAKAHALFDKYHTIEIDPDIPLKEKKIMMDTWWRTHKKLLIASGLNKKDLEKIVKDPLIKFRKGVDKFLDNLHKQNIPLVILSASGVGEAIPIYFKNAKKNYPNIYYINNSLNWSKDGRALSIREPIIHILNKDEAVIKNFPQIYKEVAKRKNVILLGDDLGDVDMITGFDYDNLIKIGFLNYNADKLRKLYSKNFDVIIEGDADFEYVNTLLKNLCT
ncbi:MAG: hypothetical protein WCS88_03525 [Patescibacteria group bacterium]|jgi:5'-nucleotidase